MRAGLSWRKAVQKLVAVRGFRIQAEAKNLELRFARGPELLVYSDPKLLHLIVINLVGNAIKYTQRGFVAVELSAAESTYQIAVKDSGPGIAPEHHARIFEPFEQIEDLEHKHLPGVGLGLSMVKQIVTSLGGEIELQSQLGAGTTITVVFPGPEIGS